MFCVDLLSILRTFCLIYYFILRIWDFQKWILFAIYPQYVLHFLPAIVGLRYVLGVTFSFYFLSDHWNHSDMFGKSEFHLSRCYGRVKSCKLRCCHMKSFNRTEASFFLCVCLMFAWWIFINSVYNWGLSWVSVSHCFPSVEFWCQHVPTDFPTIQEQVGIYLFVHIPQAALLAVKWTS